MVQLRAAFVSVALAGVLLAGCGGSSKHSSTTTFANPAVESQVAQCEATVSAQPTLSSSVKQKLEALCVKAGSGNKAEVEQAAAQVCAQIVSASVPPSKRAAAVAQCPKP
jgi:cytochrome c1